MRPEEIVAGGVYEGGRRCDRRGPVTLTPGHDRSGGETLYVEWPHGPGGAQWCQLASFARWATRRIGESSPKEGPAVKPPKPNLSFLQEVADGKVMWVRGHSQRRGGYVRFIGGEKTAKAHSQAGYIDLPGAGMAELGRPARATLTPAGRAALSDANQSQRTPR